MSRPPDPHSEKAALREAMGEARAQAREAAPEAGRRMAEVFLASPLAHVLRPGGVVSGYWPIRSELDPRPLLEALVARGAQVALPVMPEETGPLLFRAWAPGVPTEAHGFGTRVPPAKGAVQLRPAMVLMPMLAFDRRGARLGYGKGHYDRTLAYLRSSGEVLAVGLAFAAQEVTEVPTELHDERFDWMVTEREAIRIRTNGNEAVESET